MEHIQKSLLLTLIIIAFGSSILLGQIPQVGDLPDGTSAGRPNYDTYRMDKIAAQGDATYSGDLNLSIPLLVVPGRHGHDFPIQLNYNSFISQYQKASWVGLGWNLEVGGIERTVQGRADDQVDGLLNGDYLGPEPGTGGYPPWRAQRYGRMNINQRNLAAADQDQADMYNVTIDGGNQELYYIPDTVTYYLGYNGPYKFLTPQYKTWDVQAFWSSQSGPIISWGLTKEDGTVYAYGTDVPNYGSIDNVQVMGQTYGGQTQQKCTFPYRWSLKEILYPDGSQTRVTYNKPGSPINRKFESNIMDRSYPWQANLFSPDLHQVYHTSDSLRYWYSTPESLYTDTHYLVFRTSVPSNVDASAKNRRLDTLILYDRFTCKELKRVVFTYASASNPNQLNGTVYPWVYGTMLGNDQLTLESVSVRTPDNITVDAVPPYSFTYGLNPRFDVDLNENMGSSDPTFPGYQTDTTYCTAWRLKTMTLPTGGRIEYSYQILSENSGDAFTVTYDPEGQSSGGGVYNLFSQPRCRLAQKRVVDTLGISQVFTLTYGIAVYDAPSRPLQGSYQPKVYASTQGSYPYALDYYKYYRGCTIGHRWVKMSNPDGSWKKTYYTSSYQASDKNALESQPDSLLTGSPANNATIEFSNYGKRGLVWKEETNLSSTVYYYSYLTEWKFTDPYRYNWLYNNNYSYSVELRSIWPRLDSIQTTRDGITSRTQFTYNPTRIDNYGVWNRTGTQWYSVYPGWQNGISCNGLVNWKYEFGDELSRFTYYDYACGHYNSMDSVFMLSQRYSTKVMGAIDESRDWTTYGKIAGLWLPISHWVWNDSAWVTGAPGDTSTANEVTDARFTYDGSSCSDVVSKVDGNGNTTNLYYSSDTTNPFSNTTNGLLLGRVTGVEKVRGGSLSPLRTSFTYDGYGNITKQTSENGNVTRMLYDRLGRLTSVISPSGQTTLTASYSYYSSPALPNLITAIGYRTNVDSTSSRTYYDGIGYEIQKQMSFGSLDIISHTAYDSMRHPATKFLPYQCDLGGASEHNFDPSFFNHASAYNAASGIYPFDLTEFERDPSGRALNQFYSDTMFSNSDRVNNHFTKLSYGANGSNVPGFAASTLHSVITSDENGAKIVQYFDKLGNSVATVSDSGGLALMTTKSYDATGRVVNVNMPKNQGGGIITHSLFMSNGTHSGQIDEANLPGGAKVITVRLQADTGGISRAILGPESAPLGSQRNSPQGVRPGLYFGGVTVIFNINQYLGGSLIAHKDSLSIWAYPGYPQTVMTLPYVPTIRPEADEVKLVIDTVCWYYSQPGPYTPSATLSLDCQTSDFQFVYNKRGLLQQKSIPDQGTTSYLYDKSGNLRFVMDAAHTGLTANNVNPGGSLTPPNSASGQFTLTMPGPVTIYANIVQWRGSGSETIKIKANGVYVLSAQTSGTNNGSATLPLPKGTYTYEVTTGSGSSHFSWSVACQTNYEFVYNKYDALNRVIEQGEYPSSSASADFTRTNAENASFPGSGATARTLLYDTASTDAIAAGQRNLLGKLSQVATYRLGSVALTTFYSYDDFGRVEWIAYRGFSSNGMKIAYAYDLQNNVTKKTFTDYANATNNNCWWYEYDQANRLARVFSGPDSSSRIKEADYTYSASGKVTQLQMGATPAQTVTYTYTDRNWLSTINSAQFWEHLGYNTLTEIGSALGASAQYNGNTSWMSYSESGNNFTWGPPVSTTTLGYAFGYDNVNRLTAANFGFNYSGWSSWNSYNMPKIGYDQNGNIDTLVRYGTNATLMDNLKYHYLANSNRLDYIADGVASGTFTSDIDNEQPGNYHYDANGNVQADSGSGMGFILYDINNLPVAEYRRDGTAIQYTYDNSGQRAIKLVNSAYTWYIPGASGVSEVLYANATTNPTYLVHGNDVVAQVKRTGPALTRYYYLKDHLGTNRMTVRGDSIVLADDFSGTLSQWTTAMGSGYCILNGELVDSSAGDNVLINASAATFGDGMIGADVKTLTGDYTDANLVVRYQDANNFYLVQVYGGQIIIFKRITGTYYNQASVGISPDFMGGFYRLQATVVGGTFTVYWKGQQVLTWTDPSPWTSGKVGVRQCNSRNIHWDNFSAVTFTTGQVVAYDDYYPYGQLMDGRSLVVGADGRYKYTGKERDAETGWDYFGARYYDARVGRWLIVDPLTEKDGSVSPYNYCHDNSISRCDEDGAADFGSAEKLTAAGMKALNQKWLNSTVYSDDAGKEHWLTHCNEGTRFIFQQGGDNSLDNPDWNANAMVDFLSNPQNGIELPTYELALKYANEGITVVAGHWNPHGSGHVAVVAPGGLVSGWGDQVPEIFDIGRQDVVNLKEPVSAGFQKQNAPAYYILNKDKEAADKRIAARQGGGNSTSDSLWKQLARAALGLGKTAMERIDDILHGRP